MRSGLTPGEARELVAEGALLASDRRRAARLLPRIRARSHPGFIDLWNPVDDAATYVVHVHGEVLRGDLMG